MQLFHSANDGQEWKDLGYLCDLVGLPQLQKQKQRRVGGYSSQAVIKDGAIAALVERKGG